MTDEPPRNLATFSPHFVHMPLRRNYRSRCSEQVTRLARVIELFCKR